MFTFLDFSMYIWFKLKKRLKVLDVSENMIINWVHTL